MVAAAGLGQMNTGWWLVVQRGTAAGRSGVVGESILRLDL